MPTPAELAARWGLTPHAALHLSGILKTFPTARVTSGRRSASTNRRVGGSPTSFHLRGRAADVVVPRHRAEQLVAYARSQRVTARCTGPEEVIDEGDHIHLAW